MANMKLIKNNEFYPKLLLSEWFFISKEILTKKRDTLKNYQYKIEEKSREIEKNEKPKEPKREYYGDSYEYTNKLQVFLFILYLLGSAFVGYCLGWLLGVITFPLSFMIPMLGYSFSYHNGDYTLIGLFDTENVYSFVLRLVFAAITVGVMIFVAYKFIPYFEDLDFKETGRVRLTSSETESRYNNTMKSYEISLKTYKDKIEPYKKQISSYKENINGFNKYINTLEKAYNQSLSFIYPKYRNIVCVCQFTQYIESGRCDRFDGPYGCYNLYENESRLDLIIDKLDVVISKMDQIMQNQTEIITVLKSIDKRCVEIKDSINMQTVAITSTINLATLQLSNAINNVEASVNKAGSTISDIDRYMRVGY